MLGFVPYVANFLCIHTLYTADNNNSNNNNNININNNNTSITSSPKAL